MLGDLHERYKSPARYLADAITTAPFVILSRIRRATDPQFLLLEALLIYASYVVVAWYQDRALLAGQSGLLRLAIPAGITLVLAMRWKRPGCQAGSPPTRFSLRDHCFAVSASDRCCRGKWAFTAFTQAGCWMRLSAGCFNPGQTGLRRRRVLTWGIDRRFSPEKRRALPETRKTFSPSARPLLYLHRHS